MIKQHEADMDDFLPSMLSLDQQFSLSVDTGWRNGKNPTVSRIIDMSDGSVSAIKKRIE